MKKLNYLVFVGLIIASLAACKDEEADEPIKKFTYEANAAPVFNANCSNSGCHNKNSVNGSLANFEDAKIFATEGKEELLGAIDHLSGFEPMPKFRDKMSETNRTAIKKWISDGLLEK